MVSAAQLQQVAGRFGAIGGQSASWQVLADGANEAMRTGGMKTVNECAGFLSQVFVESGFLRYTQELGHGQRYAPYIGRTYIQLTWRANYVAFGKYAKAQGWVTDEDYFVNNPQALAQQKWAWRGALYFFTQVNFSGYGNLVKVCDTGDIYKISRAVNAGNPNWGGTPYGMSQRLQLWNAFRALGGSIAPSAPAASGVKGAIPGTAAQVVAKAYAELKLWGGHQYCYAWPRLRELGKSSEYWCADFVWYVYWKGVGYNFHDHTSNPSYCPNLYSWFEKDPLWNRVSFTQAQPGDVILFNRSGTFYHVGLVVKAYANGSITTIEGDTSTPRFPGSESSAGCLAEKTRQAAFTSAYIYRGTWTDTSDATVDTDDSDPTTPGSTAPTAPQYLGGGLTVTANPDMSATRDEARRFAAIRAASPSRAFMTALRDHHNITNDVRAFLGDHEFMDLTPYLVASDSQVTNDSSQAVRREASLTLRPSTGDTVSDRMWDALAGTPGLTVQVKTGIEYATGAQEVMPVHSGPIEKIDNSLPGGLLKLVAPDEAQWMVNDALTQLTPTDTTRSTADMIRALIQRVDPKATLWDQTPVGLPLPSLALEGNIMDNITRLAQSLGAECFSSPVPHLWILRPVAGIMSRAKWFARWDEVLISMSRGVDYSGVFNSMTVTANRADTTPAEATWEITDPRHPFRVRGPFKRKHGSWSSSALATQEDCTTAAQGIVNRLIGNHTTVSWTQRRNPAVETGDVAQVADAYRMVIDKYTLPLGKDEMSAEARSLKLDGVSAG